VLRVDARKRLINGFIGSLVLPHIRQRYAADAMAADRVNFDRLKANRFLPDRVFVQISRRCNLTCSMCGRQIWKRNKGFMSVDLFKRVIAKMTANGNRFSALPTSVFPACELNVHLKSIARPWATAISGRWRRP